MRYTHEFIRAIYYIYTCVWTIEKKKKRESKLLLSSTSVFTKQFVHWSWRFPFFVFYLSTLSRAIHSIRNRHKEHGKKRQTRDLLLHLYSVLSAQTPQKVLLTRKEFYRIMLLYSYNDYLCYPSWKRKTPSSLYLVVQLLPIDFEVDESTYLCRCRNREYHESLSVVLYK